MKGESCTTVSLSVSLSEDVEFARHSADSLEDKPSCVSAAVSDESVAGDSGVYEASVKR